MSANIENERYILEATDDVIGHIFGGGLILTGSVRVQHVDDDVGERLQEALNEFDAAICELRTATCTRVIVENKPRLEPRHVVPAVGHRQLCHVADHPAFTCGVAGTVVVGATTMVP